MGESYNLIDKTLFAAKHPRISLRHLLLSNTLLHYLYVNYGEWKLRGFRDRQRLEKTMPELSNFNSTPEDTARQIRIAYREYTSKVSSAVQAISLELAYFLWFLCRVKRPYRILDLGSGFSSFVFRLLTADKEHRPEVWSVDTDPYWLEQTRAFLRANHISDDNLITWDDFCSEERGEFQLVLHDIGGREMRSQTLEHVIRLAQPEAGLVILDDMHRSGYRAHVTRTVERMGSIDCNSLRVYTLDKLGRYSGLLMRSVSTV